MDVLHFMQINEKQFWCGYNDFIDNDRICPMQTMSQKVMYSLIDIETKMINGVTDRGLDNAIKFIKSSDKYMNGIRPQSLNPEPNG